MDNLCTNVADRRRHLSFSAIAICALALFASTTATAQLQYTEVVLYDSDAPPAMPTIANSSASLLPAPYGNGVSMNNNGEIAFGAQLRSGVIDSANIIVRQNGEASGEFVVLYQGNPAGSPGCWLTDANSCLSTDLYAQRAVINDSGDIGFTTRWVDGNNFQGGEFVVHGNTGLSVLAQSVDDSAGTTYQGPFMTDFNNLGISVGYATASCGNPLAPVSYSVLSSDTSTGTGIGVSSATLAPAVSWFDSCAGNQSDPTRYTIQYNDAPSIGRNSNTLVFAGGRDDRSSANNDDYGIYQASPGSSAGLVTAVEANVGRVVTNDRGDIVYSVADYSTGDLVYSIFVIRANETQPVRIASGLDAGWTYVNGLALALNSNGTVAFIAIPETNPPVSVESAWLYHLDTDTVEEIPNTSQFFGMVFDPQSLNDTGELVVVANAPPQRTLIVKYSLQPVATPEISVVAMQDMGALELGDSATTPITVANVGTAPLIISTFTPPAAPFSVSNNNCGPGTSVDAGNNCTFDVTFQPTQSGTVQDVIQIESNDPDPARQVVTLTLSGRGIPPVVLTTTDTVEPFDDQAIDFGVKGSREVGMEFFTITNAGEEAVSLGAVLIENQSADVFGIRNAGATCDNATLDPAQDCTVELWFSSEGPGTFTATARTIVTGADDIEISLSGSVDIPDFDLEISKTASVDTVTAGSGENIEYTITVSNNGPDAAPDVSVIEYLPADVVLSGTPVCSAAVSCFDDGAGQWSDTWMVGTLESGESATATILVAEAFPDPVTFSCLENAVSTDASGMDSDTSSNADNAITGGGNCADLSLVGQVTGTALSTTEATVTANATLTNNGPDDVAAAFIDGLSYLQLDPAVVTVSAVRVTGCNNAPPTGEDANYVCEVGSLANGESKDVSIEFDLTATAAFDISVLVDARGSDDLNGLNDTYSASETINLQQPPPPPPADTGSDSGNCFIATAAYGSYLEPEVMVLREFRDNWLMTNRAGRGIVDFYYAVSPPIADVIAGNEALRAITRVLLSPLVYGVKYPLVPAVLLVFAGAFVRRRYRVRARAL